MKRPSFQFYPGDWQSDLKLRRCSPAARGVWIDVLCALHNSDDGYGFLRWPLREIARTVGASMAHITELVDKAVLRGSDTEITEPLVYVSRSGRKEGAPVTLIAAQAGPLWFSKRLVKDEYVRTIRGESTRFGDSDGESPKHVAKAAPKPPFGDGTSSSSSSSSSSSERERARASRLPAGWDPGPEGMAYAERKGLRNGRASTELESFRDWWAAQPGQKGVKADWAATWRTWVRRALERQPATGQSDAFAGSL